MIVANGTNFDLEAWTPANQIELWEDNAGGLLITQAGEATGFDVSDFADGTFVTDAISLATGDGLHNWSGDFYPVDRENSFLVATYTLNPKTLEVFEPGYNGSRYIGKALVEELEAL